MITQNHPKIRPTLLLDFVNGQTLDPRMAYTSASPQEYFGGEMVVAEQNLFLQSAIMIGSAGVGHNLGGVRAGAVNHGDGTATLSGAAQDAYRALNISRPVGAKFSVKGKLSGTGKVRLMGLNGGGGFISDAPVDVTLAETPVEYFWAGINNAAGINCGISIRGAGDGSPATVKIEDIQFRDDHLNAAYVPTTTAPITRYQPKLSVALPNEPFFPRNPVTGEREGLETRGAVTNMWSWSDDFTDSSWAKVGVTVLPNQAVAPDGTLTMGKLIPGATAGNRNVNRVTNAVAGEARYVSLVFKAAGHRYVSFRKATNGQIEGVCVDLETRSVVARPTDATWTVAASAKFEDWGNGLVLVRIAFISDFITGSWRPEFVSHADPAKIYGASDGVSGVYAWRGGMTSADFFGILPKTEGSQVTRTAVVPSMPVGDWLSKPEGTIYCEIDVGKLPLTGGNDQYIVGFNETIGVTAGFGVAVAGGSGFRFGVYNTGDARSPAGSLVAGVNKIVATYNQQETTITVNGGATFTGTRLFDNVFRKNMNLGGFGNGNYPLNHPIKRIAIYPREISVNERKALSAL